MGAAITGIGGSSVRLDRRDVKAVSHILTFATVHDKPTTLGRPCRLELRQLGTRWDEHRINRTWSENGTHGGVLGYLDAASVLRFDPAYNQSATLYGEQYEGTVSDWEFLTGDVDDPDRVPLALDEPVVVSGPDPLDETADGGKDDATKTPDDETKDEWETEAEREGEREDEQETCEEEQEAREEKREEGREEDDD